jgi:hypothetical protein
MTQSNRNLSETGFQFRIVHLMYVFALTGAALATLGIGGLFIAFFVIAFWAILFFSPHQGTGCFYATLLVVACAMMTCCLPTFQISLYRSRRVECLNNLKNISLACHNYLDTHGSFPPAYIADKSGKPMHSWRVLILPYLEEQRLFDQYDFNEPWDGPNNRKLISKVPYSYRCPGHRYVSNDKSPSYFAVVGPSTAWPGESAMKPVDFPDGMSNTVLLIEDNRPQVAWTEPIDLSMDEALELVTSSEARFPHGHLHESFFSVYSSGSNAVFADASGQYFDSRISKQTWARMLARNDGKKIEPSEYDMANHEAIVVRWKYGNIFRLVLLVVLILLPTPWTYVRWANEGRAVAFSGFQPLAGDDLR